jgi:hypothetical protein
MVLSRQMARWFALTAGAIGLAFAALGADELPKSDQDDSFEVEPPLLIPYRDPGTVGGATALTAPTPAADLERLAREVERSKRSAISAERLFRMGALAKIEAEQRALKAVRLQADLENARLAQAKTDLAAQNNGEPSSATASAPSPSDADLARAIEAAHAAAKKREQAELEAAETNLARQQKLLSLGSGRKADVAKAERKLAELKAAQN